MSIIIPKTTQSMGSQSVDIFSVFPLKLFKKWHPLKTQGCKSPEVNLQPNLVAIWVLTLRLSFN